MTEIKKLKPLIMLRAFSDEQQTGKYLRPFCFDPQDKTVGNLWAEVKDISEAESISKNYKLQSPIWTDFERFNKTTFHRDHADIFCCIL